MHVNVYMHTPQMYYAVHVQHGQLHKRFRNSWATVVQCHCAICLSKSTKHHARTLLLTVRWRHLDTPVPLAVYYYLSIYLSIYLYCLLGFWVDYNHMHYIASHACTVGRAECARVCTVVVRSLHCMQVYLLM